MKFVGWVNVEEVPWVNGADFEREGGSFVVMKRDEGDPVEWKRVWRGVVGSEAVGRWVLRKGAGQR